MTCHAPTAHDQHADADIFLPTPPVAEDRYQRTLHKKWWTKTIRAPGNEKWVFNRYRGIPHIAIPRHTAVNDLNQDFCGGWFRFEHSAVADPRGEVQNHQCFLAHRVLHGLKPAAELWGPEWAIHQWARRFGRDGQFNPAIMPPHSQGGNHTLFVVARGTPNQVFGTEYLDEVEAYYRQAVPMMDFSEIFRTWREGDGLHVLFQRPDWSIAPDSYLPIVGLTLGYPIENTASLLLR